MLLLLLIEDEEEEEVRFVCCLRPEEGGRGRVPVGDARVFWCVAIESVDDED